MGMKVATLGLAYLFLGLAVLIGFGSSNFDQDKAECADKLVGLATCVQFVEGNAKSPTPDCCTGFKQVVDKSSKCLCVLIKDRNDPSLGIKINATLALQLPSDCHTPFNVTSCIDLLHLKPNSTEAKEFEGFAKDLKGNVTNTSPVGAGSTGGGTSANVTRGNGARGTRWQGRVEMVLWTLLWFLTPQYLVFYV